LRRYARILTDDPERADQLVEETLARARELQDESLSPETPDMRFIALLRSVSASRAADMTPREAPASATRADPRSRGDARPGARSAPSQPDRGAEMLRALRELPLEQREILVLVAVEHLSYPAIADLLRMPVATVISRLSQAREALRARASRPHSTPHTY
jgi:RNA polymerase sigma-70 factor (ECF subfamily)